MQNGELRPAPLAFVTSLMTMVFHLLDENIQHDTLHNRLGQLTWHGGIIPCNKIWVKITGDKGGSSFRTFVQVVNVHKPNSVRNSYVFVVFEAPDTLINLHIALDRWYHHEISDIQLTKLK